jgi:hypothetical protein
MQSGSPLETAYAELKQSILGGRVLRARTPAGIEQEIYALLVAYQALRIAISDATIARPDIDPDRGSFTVALHAAREQLIKAAGVIAETTIDLVGVIGRQVLNNLLPDRRCRTSPRVVKRAISKHAAHTASGRLHTPATRPPSASTSSPTLTLDKRPPQLRAPADRRGCRVRRG